MNRQLDGQVAWITGGASGIGEATARLLASEGAKVALVDVQCGPGKNVAAEINDSGGRAIFIECDVGVEDQVKASIKQTVREFGSLQTIVNSAGMVHIGRLHEISEADWDHLMNINLKSIFFSIKFGFQHLQKHDRSYVVNVGSISSFVGQLATPVYTASKGAVLMLSRSIALDYAAEGLRCNCVCPGITDTPMLHEHLNTADLDAAIRQRVRRVPMNIVLTPEDIARSILYLSCENSAGITGTSLIVDGGYLAAAEWDSDTGCYHEENQR